jgi:hypothetical protein
MFCAGMLARNAMPTPLLVLMWAVGVKIDKYGLAPSVASTVSLSFEVSYFTGFIQIAVVSTTGNLRFFTISRAYHSKKIVMWFFRFCWYPVCSSECYLTTAEV